MTKGESEAENKQASTEDDDEPDEWDKRIFSTGCSEENWKLTECQSDKKDWRQCTKELGAPNAQLTNTPLYCQSHLDATGVQAVGCNTRFS
ncbi:hypothetical protein PspLS_03887 [Pyricularia sp. CBS 133598]|nr:hypothetical protein PspLS_03887 [Pyricularia sp. CBS 133598]